MYPLLYECKTKLSYLEMTVFFSQHVTYTTYPNYCIMWEVTLMIRQFEANSNGLPSSAISGKFWVAMISQWSQLPVIKNIKMY